MRSWFTERASSIAIGVLLLVLVRRLGEFFRVKHLYGQALMIDKVEHG